MGGCFSCFEPENLEKMGIDSFLKPENLITRGPYNSMGISSKMEVPPSKMHGLFHGLFLGLQWFVMVNSGEQWLVNNLVNRW